MRKLLPICLFTLGCLFISAPTTAQNVNCPKPHEQTIQEDSVLSELNELLKDFIIPPQPNRAQDAREARMKMRSAAENESPYRPLEVITRNEKGDLFMKYSYIYDEKGTFVVPPATPMARDYKLWNKIEQVWDNNMRFRLILNEDGDIVEAFTDLGFKTRWDNYYRITYTYDENRNQLTSCQEKWENDKWNSTLRWTNTFDANGNVLTRQYENRPLDGEWDLGLRQTWTYDEAGRELSELNEQYSKSEGKYSDNLKEVYTYDEQGNMTTWIREQRGVPFFYQTLEYDANNNKTSILEKRWVENDWANFCQSTYTYDDQNRVTFYLYELWNEGQWNNNYKAYTSYVNQDSEETNYGFDKEQQAWIENERMIKTYNEKNQQTSWVREAWIKNSSEFMPFEREVFTYNTDFNMTNRTAETWSTKEEKFIATSIFDYEYDSHMNGIKIMSPRKQSREWINLYYDNMQNEWASPDYDSWIAECTYLDLREYTKPSEITLDKNSHELEPELTVQLEANILPANASNKEIYWSSSNPEVARVNVDGRVYGIVPGTATITARTLIGDLTASCEIKVTDPTSIKQTEAQTTFTFQNQIIRFSGESISKVQVSDVNGRIIFHQNDGKEINTSGWDKGIYFIQLSDASGNHISKFMAY